MQREYYLNLKAFSSSRCCLQISPVTQGLWEAVYTPSLQLPQPMACEDSHKCIYMHISNPPSIPKLLMREQERKREIFTITLKETT